ncbi:MAG: hypothetical protein KC503_14285 [Myxococcales bacterium]|nr:hypothetical protein [Myxococcales bacterium]
MVSDTSTKQSAASTAAKPCPLCGEPMVSMYVEDLCPSCGHTIERAAAVRRGRRGQLIAVLVALGLLVVIGGTVVLSLSTRAPAEGYARGSATVTVAGRRLVLQPTECRGDRRVRAGAGPFAGVALLPAAPRVVALTVSPIRRSLLSSYGPSDLAVVLWQRQREGAPWRKTRLARADCQRFDVTLELRPMKSAHRHHAYAGKVHASCARAGVALEASLSFDHCQRDPALGVFTF